MSRKKQRCYALDLNGNPCENGKSCDGVHHRSITIFGITRHWNSDEDITWDDEEAT